MRFNNAEIPAALVDAAFAGSLIVFAGAGVSMQKPLEFPSFDCLIDLIKEDVDPANRLKPRKFSKDAEGNRVYRESPEQYLGYLESSGCNIRRSCSALLASNGRTSELHKNLLRLFPNGHQPKVITTNFDDCFENAAMMATQDCPVFSSPALPLGGDIDGIVHLHGDVGNLKSMVLTASDYGRAYVTDGWVSRFLVDLFRRHCVLFVGYSCGDSLVDYLTRSISVEMSGRAFVLCKEGDDANDWLMRGVEPIAFSDYDELPVLIGELADYVEQSITDRVRELRRLGELEDLTPGQCDYLLHSLRWHDENDRAVFAQEFSAKSNCLGHLTLLRDRGLLGFLVNDRPDAAEMALIRWVVVRFSIDRCEDLQALCSGVRNELSVHFYDQLTWNLAVSDAPPSAVGPWIAWLESAPYRYHIQCMHNLAHLASNCESPDIVLAILKMLLKVNLAFSDNAFTGARPEAVIPLTDGYYEKQLLDGLNRHRGAISAKVFEHCFEQIELAYSIQTGCWTKLNAFDAISFSRSAVEPHEQDRYAGGAGSVLLNIARDAVDSTSAEWAASKCLSSRCALLVRLGLSLIEKYNCNGSNLETIETGGYLENILLHHEVFQLARSAFEVASPSQRRRFINYLRHYYANKKDSDYACFNLCNWILEKVDDSELRDMREAVLTRNPNYLAREHPDFSHYMTSGVVDAAAECRIEAGDFTIPIMLGRLAQPKSVRWRAEPYEIVSVPAGDYPDMAIDMVRGLLHREQSAQESVLCNLLIETIAWDSPRVGHDATVELLVEALGLPETCSSAIGALSSCVLFSRDSMKWTIDELEQALLAAMPHVPILINARSALIQSDSPDWGHVGINQPAGKYLELITELERMEMHSGQASKAALSLLKNLDILSLSDSPAAKGLIACFFMSFNLWAQVDDGYSRAVAKLLGIKSWSQVPAWQGMARLSRLSEEAWDITADYWKVLFEGNVEIEGDLENSLVRLYTWLAIVRADNDNDKSKMLMVCGSASDKALEMACLRIDDWFGALDYEQRSAAWSGWLSDSFKFLAANQSAGATAVARVYCKWAREFPEMRAVVSRALLRDCANLKDAELVIHEGTLSDIATDEALPVSDKAVIIIFMLEHQRHFVNEYDAREAASHIRLNALDSSLAMRLQDAFTRCGMVDVEFLE